jgi:hypothetical protein
LLELGGSKLNGWLVVGYIGTAIGAFLLILGLAFGLTAYNAVSVLGGSLGGTLGQTVFFAAFFPFGVTGGIFAVGGIAALYAGSRVRPKEAQSVTQTVNMSIPSENERPIVQAETKFANVTQKSQVPPECENMLPLPKQGVCPSCEYPIVYIEKYQRWYCVNERKYI